MSKRYLRGALAALILTLPIAALADVSGTGVTISSGSNFSLDTGAVVSTGGDFSWNGTTLTITPQGSATAIDLENTALGNTYSGLSSYTMLVAEGQVLISSFAVEFGNDLNQAPIPPNVDDILVFHTNAGNYAAVLVTATSPSLTIDFHTFTPSTTPPPPTGPTISAVVNNYSYIPTGFPNSGIAPGTIMLIFGSGMSQQPSSVFLNSSAAPGLPTKWEGATLSVTVGTKTVTPSIYYATPTQIAAVLPSGTPPGTASITVSYNSQTSAAFQFQVVPSALGFNTYFGNGSGLLLAVDATSGSIINYTNSAKPGETLLLFGSGLGADTADSDTTYTKTPHPVSTPLEIYFGPVATKVLYSGSSGYPGYDQINVTIPDKAPTDCFVGVVGVTGSGNSATTSNFGSLPISASGGQCTSTILGITGQTISELSSNSTVTEGSVVISQLVSPANPPATGTTTRNGANASFTKETGSIYSTSSGVAYSIGSCFVTEIASSSSGGTSTSTGLDAGTITLTGPEGSYTLTGVPSEAGDYYNTLPSTAIPSTGGAFTFTGSGGSGTGAVGPFKATVNLPNPILDWTNQSTGATITRTQGVTVKWTGGGPGTFVIISGQSSDISGSGASGSFTCLAIQSAGTFTVPNYVTLTLPAGTGSLAVENAANFGTFTASGLNYGTTFGFTGVSVSSTYQ